MKYKEICLDDIFDFPSINSGITEKFIRENKGDIPVYGSRKDGKPVGYIANNLSNKKYFSRCLTWNRNGSVGYTFYRDHKFMTTDDCRPLVLKKEYEDKLDYNFLRFIVQDVIFANGFAWNDKAGKEKMKLLYISIPIHNNGNFDFKKQKELAAKYNKILSIKEKIKIHSNTLINTQIKIDDANESLKFEEACLSKIFDFPAINSGITEKFIREHQGNIPVYGGRKEERPVGYISDNLEGITYFENCLAWNREGSIGYVFWHKHKFITNDHHRPIILKEEYKNTIDLNYVRFVLQEFLLSQGFVWSKTASKEKVKEFSIPIPIKKNGSYDIKKQKEIAQKYISIENKQKQVIDMLKRIQETQVKLNIG